MLVNGCDFQMPETIITRILVLVLVNQLSSPNSALLNQKVGSSMHVGPSVELEVI